ncbi:MULTISPECIES: outer membrane lipoprotein [Undibacterium]|jgi:outer membrane lipoprotein SlyB|uniref:Glycine zipper 2TM domain-containing protein n=1 Tax=Undibacterium umbellatum TaxID=2762300 RepID=A0ABR6Z897_9BURK|nr:MULTISPECIES: glycine zipper 2TM domain-containing protein [Undibacterium]MBC3907531.1 glycine zipper 2TM domain-containing protein [Undibacterium umbellatum]MDP1979623.1 glycine zipper 2TM domain-containing protein [Undibacterium sp.]
MNKKLLVASLMLTAVTGAFAQNMTAKQQYAADTKRATQRYNDDKKLCAEAGGSAARMQCLRDAKADYNNSLAVAKQNMSRPVAAPAQARGEPACPDCGKVVAIEVKDKEGEGGALGVIAGGVAGALLGNQVGGGTGRDLATIAGAAGGALAGHKIEQKVKTTKVWNVTVAFENGNRQTYVFDHDPGLMSGDAVRGNGSSIVRR